VVDVANTHYAGGIVDLVEDTPVTDANAPRGRPLVPQEQAAGRTRLIGESIEVGDHAPV
jgi:hypothetical protein